MVAALSNLHTRYWCTPGSDDCTPVHYGSASLVAALGVAQEALPRNISSSLSMGPGGEGAVEHHLALRHLHGTTLTPRLRAVSRSCAEQAAIVSLTGVGCT